MNLLRATLLFLFLLTGGSLAAQQTITFTCTDSLTGEKLPGVVILQNGKGVGAADAAGIATLTLPVPATLVFRVTGYVPKTVFVSGNETSLDVRLLSLSPEMETVTIQATRNNSRIDDSPTKTEVLGQDDMDEENGIKPGNMSSLLGDLSSIQVQNTSPVSNQSVVRIQGLSGRYTQLLRDGLPVYDGFASGFGILQLPPADLKQVELIKGPASTLYGGGAIGGLVNFVSREPGDSAERRLTGNISTLGELNTSFWSSAKLRHNTGYTLLLSSTIASPADVNHDSLSDVPAVVQWRGHTRLFFRPGAKNSLIVGLEGSAETREGGDLEVLQSGNDSSGRYFSLDRTRRGSGEFHFMHHRSDSLVFGVKGSATVYDRSMKTEAGRFNGTQFVNYLEGTCTATRKKQTLLFGVNLFHSAFGQRAPVHDQPALHEKLITLGVFAQATFYFTPKLILEAGIRTDRAASDTSNTSFVLPRVAFLWKWNDRTGLRIAAGMGYRMPQLLPLVPDEHRLPEYLFPQTLSLQPENSAGGTFDVYWRRRLGEDYSIYLSQSFFLTQVDHPIVAEEIPGDSLHLFNAGAPLLTYGSDSYIRLTGEKTELYLGYTWTHATRRYDSSHPFIPVTPPHRVSFVWMYEPNEKWRTGLEGSWISRQYREDGSRTSSYFISAVMVACEWRHFTFVLNCENLLNVLQSHYEPLYTGTRLAPVFSPLWAPIDGRVINFSVQYKW